jgi:hypothetical protein
MKTAPEYQFRVAPGYTLMLAETGEGAALPLSLEGHPTKDAAGKPIHYRKVMVAPFGNWVHRSTGEPIVVTPARADEWIKNVAALAASGVKPFVTSKHVYDDEGNFIEPDARNTLGYVVRMERDEKGVYSIVALHGDESLEVAAKNSRSVGVSKRDFRDATGKTYPGETLHHLALVPNPALQGLGDLQQIAASADAPHRDVPVYVLAADHTSAPSRKGHRMKPEIAQQVRAKLGFGADVSDDQLDDKAAEKALALSADAGTLTVERDNLKQQVTTLTAERDEHKSTVLQLSADNKEPDALSLGLISRAFKTERDQVIASGVISQAGMDELDKVLLPGGKPSRVALALSAGSTDPLYLRVMDILKKFPGVKTNNRMPAGVEPAEPNSYLRLSADGAEESESKMVERTRREAEEYRKQQLAARGIA